MGDLATLQDVEDALLRLLTDQEKGFAARLITKASDMVRQHCHQQIDQSTTTYTTRPEGNPWVLLWERPIVSVASVTVAGVVQDPGTYEVRQGGIWRRFGWSPYVDVVVNYTHGFSPIPNNIVSVVGSMVASRVRLAANNPGGDLQERVGLYHVVHSPASAASVEAGMRITDDYALLLKRFKREVGSVATERDMEQWGTGVTEILDAFHRSTGG